MPVNRPDKYAHYPDHCEFGKLVRDLVPEVLDKAGLIADTEIMKDDGRYIQELGLKLVEECKEVLSSKKLGEFEEEVADVLEVLMSMVKFHGGDWDRVEGIRIDKARERGSFDKRIYLFRTRPKDEE